MEKERLETNCSKRSKDRKKKEKGRKKKRKEKEKDRQTADKKIFYNIIKLTKI